MGKSRFTDQQIAFALKQAEAGVPAEEVCRKLGISQPTYYRWKKRFAGLGVAASPTVVLVRFVAFDRTVGNQQRSWLTHLIAAREIDRCSFRF